MEYVSTDYAEILSTLFYGSIILFLLLEVIIPYRVNQTASMRNRWLSNIFLGGLNMVLARFLLPIIAVGAAMLAYNENFGLLRVVSLPAYAEYIIPFFLIDLMGYLLHRASHKYSLLWRFHLVHHSDVVVDLTTTVRHHPVESLFYVLIYALTIILLGVPVICLIFYELFRFIISLFSHANIKIPNYLDRILRLLIVTPNFHCTHHASNKNDTNSNYSNSLTCWDYLFSTYNNSPNYQEPGVQLGLEYFRSKEDQLITQVILQPIRYTRKN